MNTSQFMDKQIMDLSNSSSHSNNNDFIDLMNPSEEHHGGGVAKKEEIFPSYEFHPIRPVGVSSPQSNVDSANARTWSSADSRTNAATIRNYGSVDSFEPAKVIIQKDSVDTSLLAEIDSTMKKHADNLLHVLEGVSARLSQLETRTRNLEHSVDDLKVSVGNNHGSSDGKLRQLENILREVQNCVEVVHDKQEILDSKLQLVKLQASKVEQQAEAVNTLHIDSAEPAVSAPQQLHQQLPPPLQQPSSALPPPNAPPPPSLQPNLPAQAHISSQFSQGQIPVPQRDTYFPPSHTPENPSQQYQMPPPQQLQPSSPPPPPPPHQQYQPPPPPQYSQPPPPPPQSHSSVSPVNPLQPQPPVTLHPEENPYVSPQNYPPSFRPPHQPTGSAPTQQFYGAASGMYDPSAGRPGAGFSGAYGPSSGQGEQYPYSSAPLQYGSGSPVKVQQPPSTALGQSSGSGYPQLPTARILPQALPTASSIGSGSSGTGNRVPIDDVIDKVTNMGFPRDQVRATVRKLTENGQSVDLNVVLDKLMNDGDGQPPRAWFGR